MDLYAYKCDVCGELHHPHHHVCRKCGNTEFTEEVLSGEATVATWTKVYNLPEGYMQPYLFFAIVQFDNGLIVSGRYDNGGEYPAIGERVYSTVDVVKEAVGKDFYGFIFKPVEK